VLNKLKEEEKENIQTVLHSKRNFYSSGMATLKSVFSRKRSRQVRSEDTEASEREGEFSIEKNVAYGSTQSSLSDVGITMRKNVSYGSVRPKSMDLDAADYGDCSTASVRPKSMDLDAVGYEDCELYESINFGNRACTMGREYDHFESPPRSLDPNMFGQTESDTLSTPLMRKRYSMPKSMSLTDAPLAGLHVTSSPVGNLVRQFECLHPLIDTHKTTLARPSSSDSTSLTRYWSNPGVEASQSQSPEVEYANSAGDEIRPDVSSPVYENGEIVASSEKDPSSLCANSPTEEVNISSGNVQSPPGASNPTEGMSVSPENDPCRTGSSKNGISSLPGAEKEHGVSFKTTSKNIALLPGASQTNVTSASEMSKHDPLLSGDLSMMGASFETNVSLSHIKSPTDEMRLTKMGDVSVKFCAQSGASSSADEIKVGRMGEHMKTSPSLAHQSTNPSSHAEARKKIGNCLQFVMMNSRSQSLRRTDTNGTSASERLGEARSHSFDASSGLVSCDEGYESVPTRGTLQSYMPLHSFLPTSSPPTSNSASPANHPLTSPHQSTETTFSL
jgi:hypothetical protein